ncbi:MAG: hypothetical protein ACREUB_10495 [Burkholderiales bacterium]
MAGLRCRKFLTICAVDCHVLVTDLFWPASAGNEPYRGLALPALETLLARGTRVRTAGSSLERWLAGRYRLPEGLPLAPFSLRGDGGEPGADWWMRADPVHLKVHGDRLILADAARLAVTAGESRDFVAALNLHFAGDGISFVAPCPQRWYVRTAAEARLRTTPTAEATGRNVDALLPQGEDGAHWRKVINEAQMLLHQHPCNEAREQQGRLAVNSVWIWGSGRARTLTAVYDALWTDHPVAAGLAAASGAAAWPLPPSGAALLESGRGGTHLVVLPLPATAYGDLAEWRAAAAMLERSWIAVLLEGLRDAVVESLTLHGLGPDHGYTSVLVKRDRLRLWRTRRPLRAYAA